MSQQTLDFSISGLHTYASDITGVPRGSLTRALNLDLSRTNLAQCRRGFDILDHSLPNNTDRATRLFLYDTKLFATYNNVLGMYDSGSGWSSKGALTEPANANVSRHAAINSNLYIASSVGLKKLDDTSSTLYAAGIPGGLNMTLSLAASTGTAVLNGKYAAYRYLIARKDANNNTIRGGVSAYQVIQNSSGSDKNITVVGYLPSGLDNTYFVELYRTANSSATPDDNPQLCNVYPLTNTDISNGYFTITDIYPDDNLGAFLYTSSGQQGISQNNAQPPLASDICEHKGYLFFADIEGKHRYTLTLVSVYDGSSAGQLRVDDTLTISDGTTTEIFTAKSSETAASKQFKVNTASASLSIRIDDTIRSLANVINQASTLVYAYVLATGSDLPGQMVIERRSTGNAFTVVSNRKLAWNPPLETTAGTSQTSTNDTFRNGLMWSKFGEPEAVPLANILKVGSSDDPIVRIISSKDALFIFKRRDGAYILRGDNASNWSLSELDATCKIVAPESVVQLNGLIYGLFESGICEVSDTTVGIISDPIKDKIQTLYGTALQQVRDYAFGISYETDGKYILCLPQTSGDSNATYQIIYDINNEVFWEWDINVSAGVVSTEDTCLHLAAGDSNRIRIERKTYGYSDFADFEQELSTSTSSGTTLTITSGTLDSISVGDLLLQASLQPAYVTAVNSAAMTVTVNTDNAWDTNDTIDHYKAIDCILEWNPEFAGNPAGFKHFSECALLFKKAIIQSATVSFSGDSSSGTYDVAIEGPSYNGAWGYFEWGEGAWGGDAYPQPIRKGVPRQAARCNNLKVKFSHRVAYSEWQLSGVSLVFNPTSTRVAR